MAESHIHSGFSIDLDGRNLNPLEFIQLRDERTWVKEVQVFMKEWLDHSESIEVKTSGSTGTPKVILIKKAHMTASARGTLSFLGISEGQSALLCMSAMFIGGRMMVLRSMLGGLRLTLREPTSAPLQEGDRFDLVALVPMQVENSIDLLNRVGTLIIGGAPISPSLLDKLTRRKTLKIYQTFGMTETISHIALRQLSPEREEYYHALPGVQFSSDDSGCLVIHAEAIGQPELHTHDQVRLIDERSFEWLGRRDHVINSGGVKIHPEQIEKVISKSLDREFFVAGWPDNRLGEMAIICIEGSPKTIDWPLDLPKYHRPRKLVFIPQFSRTPTGKVNRSATLAGIHPDQLLDL